MMKNGIKNLAHCLRQNAPEAQFVFELWDGDRIAFGDQPTVTLRLNTEEGARRILADGFLGFGEAYMSGSLEVEGDLQELLRLGFGAKLDQKAPSLWARIHLLPSWLKATGSVRKAPRNIAHHYDLGNGFYALYLDSTMTYSCAYFRNCSDSLEDAQRNKYDHIARKLMLSPGDRLVDIGCGWGGMLIHAARNYGITGLGITLSRRQCEYAKRKIEELGLQDRVEVILEDYRQLTGRFDKLVSIGMFEHVGKRHIRDFMKKTSELLAEDGVGLLHTIGKELESPMDPWIARYIFPGGYLPSLSEVAHHMGKAGLSVLDVENLRLHYARTLDHWIRNFDKNAEKVQKNFGESFTRMWRLYLHASSAAFKFGELRLYQFLFSKGLNNRLPITRDHLYSEAQG